MGGMSAPRLLQQKEPRTGAEGSMIVILSIACVAILLLAYAIRQTIKFRAYQGKMLVTCPETGKPAAVKVATWRGILAGLVGQHRVRLCACSGWPEREGCEQDCLCQIEANPEAHKAWTIAAKWFEGKKCVYCGTAISSVKHLDRRPALLSVERETRQWDQVPTEELPEALWGSQPVCWSCHVAESFKREFPDRVTYRPWKRSGPMGEYTTQSQNQQQRPAGS